MVWAGQLIDRLKNITGLPGPAGPPGTPGGPPGPVGPPGHGIPAGGAVGQVLTKKSGTDYDTIWSNPASGGGGARVFVGATAPSLPTVGDLWWRNDPDGVLFIYYDDGNSQQWVPATPTIKGDPGPPGTGGAGTVAYRHTQASASTTWAITHNLSFRPNVAAVDSTGREIIPGSVDYSSDIAVTLTFSAAVGGEAYLS